MAITTEIIGKLGGGEVETIPVGMGVSNTWTRLATLMVEETSLVSVVTTNPYPATANQWGVPAPTMRLLPSDGRTPDPGVTEHWASASIIDDTFPMSEFFSIAAALPPGDYAVELHMRGGGREYTVESVHTSIVPLN